MFLLDGFWNFLSFSYFVGFFPCKKTTSEDGNFANLTKCHGFLYVIKAILFIASIFTILSLLAYLVILSEEDLKLERIISVTNSAAYTGHIGLISNLLLLMSNLVHFLISYFINWKSSQKLINLQDSMTLKLSSYETNSIICKFGVFVIILFAANICQVFQMSITSSEMGVTSFAKSIPFYAFVFTINMLFYFPIMVFILIFLNVSNALREYIITLRSKINDQVQIDLNEIYMVHKILEDTRSLFSSRIFIAILSWLIMDIIMIFDIIATFIIYNFQFSEKQYFLLSYLCLYAISITLAMFYITDSSDSLKSSVMDLRSSLFEVEVPKELKIYMNDRIMTNVHAKMIAIEKLKEFNGFDGLGFFTVNRELMTGIFSNAVVYIIVLVQFLLGEDFDV